MIELLSFDELDFYWDNPRHNQRKIFGSRYVKDIFKKLGIDLDEFLQMIANVMTKKDLHYAYIGKCREHGFYVDINKFSQTTIDYLNKLNVLKETSKVG